MARTAKASPAPAPTVNITCQRCGGAGTVPLSPALAQVYGVVSDALENGLTIPDVRAALGWKHEADTTVAQNRLTKLVSLGLLRRSIDRSGGHFRYYANARC
jgi:hypothetical protein